MAAAVLQEKDTAMGAGLPIARGEATRRGEPPPAGLQLDRGRLVGSPEKLNLFTLEGEVLRTDLPLDAHLGATLHPSDVLLLEKGNRVSEDRLDAIKAAVEQQNGSCVVM